MNHQERLHLLSQQQFLQARLVAMPDSARIMRINTESWLRSIADRLAEAPVDEREPARVHLTFRGHPVRGSHGILANFAMKAVNGFSVAVTTLAASLTTPLASGGPLPNKEQHQLLITNTALGSFGFELEESGSGQLLEEQSTIAVALESTRKLLQCSIEPDNDELLADAVAGIDPRALDKIRDFVKTLAENEATCALQIGERAPFQFNNLGEVRTSLDRLSNDNVRSEEQGVTGVFQGALPGSRTFEFKPEGDRLFIIGKIGPGIVDPDEINDHLQQRAHIKWLVTTVGRGRPRYVLLEPPAWLAEDSAD